MCFFLFSVLHQGHQVLTIRVGLPPPWPSPHSTTPTPTQLRQDPPHTHHLSTTILITPSTTHTTHINLTPRNFTTTFNTLTHLTHINSSPIPTNTLPSLICSYPLCLIHRRMLYLLLLRQQCTHNTLPVILYIKQVSHICHIPSCSSCVHL